MPVNMIILVVAILAIFVIECNLDSRDTSLLHCSFSLQTSWQKEASSIYRDTRRGPVPIDGPQTVILVVSRVCCLLYHRSSPNWFIVMLFLIFV